MHTTTIWQPHASLIAIGAKPFETRNYPPPAKLIGQRIAIHAAAKNPIHVFKQLKAAEAWAEMNAICEALWGFDNEWEGPADWQFLPRGAVLCTAVLAGAGKVAGIDDRLPAYAPGVVHMLDRHGDMPDAIKTDPFGFYGPGRWCWHLTDVQRLPEPIPAKGKQGWWMWEPPAREAA